MFLNHVNNNIIIFIFICILLHHIKSEKIQTIKCKGVHNSALVNYVNTGKGPTLNEFKSRNGWIKRKEIRKCTLFGNCTNVNRGMGKYLFLRVNNPDEGMICRKKRAKFSLLKKTKDKGGTSSNVKKKPKKVFTEEEIEELRKKAKEKLQPKKDDVTTKKGRKRKKGLEKAKRDQTKDGDEGEEDEEEIKKKAVTGDVDEKDGETIDDYIKSKKDFDKIADLTKDLINEKEVEYIHKIIDCDEELLKYDKREKYIHLNYEDTIFDEGNYMHNYVNNISKFRFDIYNLHNKNEFGRITKYLNYEYIQEVPVDFPTQRSYNIELKKHFYDVVCNLIEKNRGKFDVFGGNGQEEELQFGEVDSDQGEKMRTLPVQRGKINYNVEDDNSTMINNFLRENEKEANKTSVVNENENITSVIQPTDQDIMNKYMTSDLFNLLCDIKEEYDYMFDNGGIAKFSFDENRKTHKEKLIFSGKKKRAIATVFLQKGNNNLIINNRDGYQYLQYQIFNLNKIFSPLLHLCMHRYFDVVAKVEGGGLTGQSVAIFHALVKYIVYNFSLKIKPFFRSFKFMTVDSRKVERKKYGLKKARKKKQYSKR
ncbi:30S ribosomal protein S9, putative [Plasmodium ovale]|uniref:30S ribosomal protein S9, putative n=2 Tax=Plasmodium ovale TaxID=36330 RepID=A0A1A8X0L8_PLAOA|nr:30S ribosomal protein S9, putative [Plasmodium ovale curtisi]SBS97703.1 30S ribosomal protein S9, putative [Plasmodium ovale curtisi]SCP06277.1 30S ribosomal protein S9, putative [Plasmodium ovale]